MLEELGLPYTVIPVNIRAGEQFKPEFLSAVTWIASLRSQ